jgi:hypothetical protein
MDLRSPIGFTTQNKKNLKIEIFLNIAFLAASTECSAGSNDHFVVVVVVVVPCLVQFDGRPLGGANFHYFFLQWEQGPEYYP